uniref:Uncharacterized protein n=1 Tax=Arundo donax TaxID=35708 RepID=A0A0A9BYG8_ARUDO
MVLHIGTFPVLIVTGTIINPPVSFN